MADEALVHLRSACPVMADLIARHGAPDFNFLPDRDPFDALTRSIIFQQISGAAARTIFGRFADLFGTDTPAPLAVSQKTIEDLRAVGLSNAKAKAVLDLAAKVMDGTIPPAAELNQLNDAEIIRRLTAVWGVGQWTAEMYLMFTLGRPDVLPLNDVGLFNGAQIAYGLRKKPDGKKLSRMAKKWSPHRTTACWYLWRAADTKVPD